MSEAEAPLRSLILLLVAFHPSKQEVNCLNTCLRSLPATIGYAVVVNDYLPGEPIDLLAENADSWLCNSDNPGYGRAVNRLVKTLPNIPKYLGVLNTDLQWTKGTFATMTSWMDQNPDVVLAAPQILDPLGNEQKLCKRNPTVLGLLSRRFIPDWFKPGWLKRYDRWYVMADSSYDDQFDVPYLSGCCMVMQSKPFLQSGGFDERYFLYLEDADLTREMSLWGRCQHFSSAYVVHSWGRGNYKSLRLMVVNVQSAWRYFCKWGWTFW
ncbi:glycosyltransferase family 2 protein [Synechococcus sp. MIT S9504]|uniref:glycosyltransferase family 2 protein n=1 Tax=Synechococcus sp. MIT S9504 TaxID=1801628 RepID=UPI0007BAE511|nr:glycosyltransferase family 2 protein [Synechococcus sp. MIT S9504]KZR84306.1 N-acetylglucosaminyl-diphospho-decaprenol L-rhamnosyltransferase [Synechococcus sp. MIT S9504]